MTDAAAILWNPATEQYTDVNSPNATWAILVIGEHDKGLGEPFPVVSVAGRRLRRLMQRVRVPVAITNMSSSGQLGPTETDRARLLGLATVSQHVVFLGRRVQRSLQVVIPNGIYLPHPAVRSTAQLARLGVGLRHLAARVGNPSHTNMRLIELIDASGARFDKMPVHDASLVCGVELTRPVDLLLVNSPLRDYDAQPRVHKVTLPVLGMAHIATQAKHKGLNVGVLDAEVYGLGPTRVAALTNQLRPRWIGFNLLAPTYVVAREIAVSVAPHIRVMLGGPQVKALPQFILDDPKWPRIDAMVLGEADLKVPLILADESSIHRLGGVGWRTVTGHTRLNAPVRHDPWVPQDLDSLGFVDRCFLAQDPALDDDGHIEANLVASRGCPYDCAFCGAAISANPDVGIRYRSARSLASEIEMLASEHGCSRFRFVDDLFLASANFMQKCLTAFIERGFSKRFMWDATGRINVIARADDATLDIVAQSGCREIALGIESGSERVLRLMDKRIAPEMTWVAVQKLLRRGINVKGYFILGYPNETRHDLDQTLQLIDRLWELSDRSPGVFRISAFEFRPYPGTPVWHQLLATGKYQIHDLLDYQSVHLDPTGMCPQLVQRDEFNFSVHRQFADVSLEELRLALTNLVLTQARRSESRDARASFLTESFPVQNPALGVRESL